MMNGMENFGWGFGFGWIFMVIFWGLIIVGVFALIRWLATPAGDRGGKTALDILEQRYARGELERKEYEQKRKDLQRS